MPLSSVYSDDDWKNVKPLKIPKYDMNAYNLIYDHHSHTNYSDGKLTIKQNVEWHIAMGYNALTISDHNNMRHLEKINKIKEDYIKKGILITSGIEWTTNRLHLNFLGVSKWNTRVPYRPKDEKIIETINKVHDQGGIVVCNHIPWSLYEAKYKNHPTRETLLEWGVDYIEIVNDDSLPENVFDQESYDFCTKHNREIGMLTGTDMHSPVKLLSGGVHGWTLLKLKEFTEEALLEELKKKQTKILYSEKPYLDPGLHRS
ncbi:MAG: CehA/McbA family metallohydrolase [Candidatus Lokiarchaeota archaeon]|nr:CehA/McbA family metallohydrolase [Candidatus Lokiarchaeota archaeon]